MSGGRPTAAFYLAVFAVVGGLVYFAGKQAGMFGGAGANVPAENDKDQPQIDPGQLNLGGGNGEVQAEGSSDDIVTTVKEYSYVPAQRLPPVTGTAGYQPLENNNMMTVELTKV